MNLKEILKEILGEREEEIYSLPCRVKSVDGFNCVCSPINGDPDILDVRLVADDESEDKYVLIPKVNSVVLVAFLNNNAGYLAMVSEVDSVFYKNGDTVFEVTEKFLIKKGDDTLKEALQLIVEAMQQILVLQGNGPNYTKLSQAMGKINNILS